MAQDYVRSIDERSYAPQAADEEEARASRSVHLVWFGKLSAASRALLAEPLAAGSEETLAELPDPDHSPRERQVPLNLAVLGYRAESLCPLLESLFLSRMRGARRGAVGGP